MPSRNEYDRRQEEFRRYRQAQIEQLRWGAPLVISLLAIHLVISKLLPAHDEVTLIVIGLGAAIWHGAKYMRATSTQTYGPSKANAREHHLAFALGGAIIAALGFLMAFLSWN